MGVPKERGVELQKFIVVQKPYMEQRSYATLRKVWTQAVARISSPAE